MSMSKLLEMLEEMQEETVVVAKATEEEFAGIKQIYNQADDLFIAMREIELAKKKWWNSIYKAHGLDSTKRYKFDNTTGEILEVK